MLRPKPSRIVIAKCEIDQLGRRMAMKRSSKGTVMQRELQALYHVHLEQNHRPNAQEAHAFLRRGAERTRDDYYVHVDTSCHTPSSAESEYGVIHEARPIVLPQTISGRSPGLIHDPSPSTSAARLAQVLELSGFSPLGRGHPSGNGSYLESDSIQSLDGTHESLLPRLRGGLINTTYRELELDGSEADLERANQLHAPLDPLAPAFVPRVQFGAPIRAQGVDAQDRGNNALRHGGSPPRFDQGFPYPYWESDSDSSSTLSSPSPPRVRPAQVGRGGMLRLGPRLTEGATLQNQANRRSESGSPSHTAEPVLADSTTPRINGPVVDRYPVLSPPALRPPSRHERPSNPFGPQNSDIGRATAARTRSYHRLSEPSGDDSRHRLPPGSRRSTLLRLSGRNSGERSHTTNTSASVPNLGLRLARGPTIHSRHSSLNWSHDDSRTASGSRVSSAASGASGISSLSNTQNNASHFNRGTPFARRGVTQRPVHLSSSPLDRLTDEIQNVAASSRRSEHSSTASTTATNPGRSRSRSRRNLLSGSLFYSLEPENPYEPSHPTRSRQHRTSENDNRSRYETPALRQEGRTGEQQRSAEMREAAAAHYAAGAAEDRAWLVQSVAESDILGGRGVVARAPSGVGGAGQMPSGQEQRVVQQGGSQSHRAHAQRPTHDHVLGQAQAYGGQENDDEVWLNRVSAPTATSTEQVGHGQGQEDHGQMMDSTPPAEGRYDRLLRE